MIACDILENFRNKCIGIYELDPAHFQYARGLAWQACFKKTEVEIELLTNIDMLLMIQKGIRGEIRQVIHRCVKSSNKYMKIMMKISNHHTLCIQLQAISMDRQCLKNFLQTVLNG